MVWCYGLSSWLKKSIARVGYELQKRSMIIHWKDNGYDVVCNMAILATITPRRIIVQMRNMRLIRLQSHDMLCISWPKKLNNIWHLSAPIFISFPLLVLLFYCASGLSFSIQNESLEQKNTYVVLLSIAKYSGSRNKLYDNECNIWGSIVFQNVIYNCMCGRWLWNLDYSSRTKKPE